MSSIETWGGDPKCAHCRKLEERLSDISGSAVCHLDPVLHQFVDKDRDPREAWRWLLLEYFDWDPDKIDWAKMYPDEDPEELAKLCLPKRTPEPE